MEGFKWRNPSKWADLALGRILCWELKTIPDYSLYLTT
jgi:hypothetical protein